jgi:integrase
MPSIKFTAKTIQNLQPRDKFTEYFELGRNHGTGAFGIRVSPKGKKAPTVKNLWQAYQDALSQRQKPKAPNTIRQENSMWRRVIDPTIGDMKVEDVKPADLAEMLKTYAKTSPVSANRMHALLSIMFQPALELNWITIHPLQWIKKPGGTEAPRKRVLSDEEIKAVWPHIEKQRRNLRDQIKLGLLTAQRPGEISNMKWSDIDLEQGIWKQTDTKAGNLFLVPLSPQVI